MSPLPRLQAPTMTHIPIQTLARLLVARQAQHRPPMMSRRQISFLHQGNGNISEFRSARRVTHQHSLYRPRQMRPLVRLPQRMATKKVTVTSSLVRRLVQLSRAWAVTARPQAAVRRRTTTATDKVTATDDCMPRMREQVEERGHQL